MIFSFLKRQATTILIGLVCAGSAFAQDLFSTRLYVNDKVVTEFEVTQRAMLLEVLGAPGDPEEEALKALVEDRLRMIEAERLQMTASDEEVLAGMEEFAARANLTAEGLIAELAKVGISAETYRDFVMAGVVWRKVVRARFTGGITVTENEIDQALANSAREQQLRVLVSELVIPAEGEAKAAALDLARQLSAEISGPGDFEVAARAHSKSPTAERGGRLDWMPLSNLPAELGGTILALAPGEVSDPIVVSGAVVLFMLHDIAVDTSAEPVVANVEWAEFLVPDDAAEIARIRANVDTCYDLNGQATGLPEDRLTVTTRIASDVPADVGLELARLDPGEISAEQTRSGFRRLIMLCSLEPMTEEPIDRNLVRDQLTNRKLELMAETYLEELRAAAVIREP
ncbi:MAG TPA: peptidylprolyl isomerase [Tabrizicola sp.]|nr:peptidylprolyl isomerase [Tabrizicola sp.]